LPVPDANRGEAGYVAPRTEAEQTLARIWAEVLGVDRVGVLDNFFECGGHSLLAIRLIDRMEREGLSADVRQLFAHPSVAQLAAAIDATPRRAEPAAVPENRIPADCTALRPDMLTLVTLDESEIGRVVASVEGGAANIEDVYPLTPLQEGMLFHHQLDRERDPYLSVTRMHVDTPARLGEFLAALQAVIDRHDVLRTAFLWDGLPQPVQVVWRHAPLIVERPAPGQMGEPSLDLRRAPLLKARVTADADGGETGLELLHHHLTIDHITLETLVAEVARHLDGRTQDLPEPEPFRHFVARTLAYRHDERHAEFFRRQLGDLDTPSLPFGLADVAMRADSLRDARLAVEPRLAARIRRYARERGLAAASVWHLAAARLIGAAAQRDDVVFGTVLSGRMEQGMALDRAMGLFMNTLPLRVRLDGASVSMTLGAVHRDLLGLLDHEHTPLSLAARCSALPAGAPLFSALLNYRHSEASDRIQQLDGIRHVDGTERTNYPLTLTIDDFGSAFQIEIQVAGARDAAYLCRMLHDVMDNLVGALEHESGQAPARVPMLSADEQRRIVEAWNATGVDYPSAHTLAELFEAQAARTPDAVALVAGDAQLSYVELDARANRLAHHLRTLGVGPDVRVALGVERSAAMIVGLLGILKAGGAYVPLDPAYPRERLAYMLDDAAPAVLVTEAALREVLLPEPGERAPVVVCLDADAAHVGTYPSTRPAPLAGPDHLAYVIYTSGSTGRPKGVCISHRALLNLLDSMQRAPGLDASDTLLAVTSLSFDIAALELYLPLISGARLVLASRQAAG
ncbi:AMP-binding protein, partial [Burkholderia gladioli]|uniref:AMP-binding protein n=1 Tax=Burkholderia gladioli TaxID=28095 RepID=UPI00163E2185